MGDGERGGGEEGRELGCRSEKVVFISLLLVIPQEKENQEKKSDTLVTIKRVSPPNLGAPLHA